MKEKSATAAGILTKNIAGEITLSPRPGEAMRKWRQIFGISQKQLAESLKISPSVISDYESGRRMSPGAEFVRKFTYALTSLDEKKQGGVVEKFSKAKRSDAVLDLREFLTPLPGERFIEKIRGRVVANKSLAGENIWGYTVIDSIKAILELTEEEFTQIYGNNAQRALVFTKVHMGRSPMIAIKVTKPKPSMVILHGLMPHEVDKLAVKIAEMEGIPLVVSMLKDEKELVERLREIED